MALCAPTCVRPITTEPRCKRGSTLFLLLRRGCKCGLRRRQQPHRGLQCRDPKPTAAGFFGRRAPMSKPTICKSRGIYGNCPRLARLAHPYVRKPSAIPHTPEAEPPPGRDHHLCGHLPVQSEYPANTPKRGKKEPPQPRWRMHMCALTILLNRHSPDGRRFKPNLRLFGVPGKRGPPPTRLRRVSGRTEVKPNAEIAEFSVIETHVSRGFSWNA